MELDQPHAEKAIVKHPKARATMGSPRKAEARQTKEYFEKVHIGKAAQMTWSQMVSNAQDRRKWRKTVAGLCSIWEQRA